MSNSSWARALITGTSCHVQASAVRCSEVAPPTDAPSCVVRNNVRTGLHRRAAARATTSIVDVDLRRDRHADAQLRCHGLPGVDADADGKSLHDLGEISRGVV